MANGFSITISAVDSASARIDAVNKRLAAMRAPVENLQKRLATFGRLSGITQVDAGFERMARGAYSAFQNVARVVAPLSAITGAASAAGMYRLVEAWGQWGSQLGFAAQNMGISADRLQSLQGAALIAGSSASDLTQGMQSLGQTMYDAIGGRAPEAVAMFNQLGLAFDDGTRHIVSVDRAFKQLADRIASVRDPFAQLKIATAAGISPSLLPLLRLGSKGISDLQEKTSRYGVTNAAGVAAANRMREAQADLTLAVTGLGNSIAERLSPVIAPLLDQMAGWIAANRGWIAQDIGKYVGQFAAYVQAIDWKSVEGGLDSFYKRADAVAQAFGGWKRVLEGIVGIKLAGWAAGAIAPFTSILRLLALVPGSGVTVAGLAAAGIEVGAIKLADAAVGSVSTQGDVRENHDELGKWIYDNSPALRYADNWLYGNQPNARSSSLSSAEQSKRASIAFNAFALRGFSAAQSAWLVANIQAESGFKEAASGDSGLGYGLGLWHPYRQQDFMDWAGHDIRKSDFKEQINFYAYELLKGKQRDAGKRLLATTSPYAAGEAVSLYDERPRAAAEAAHNRGLAAMSIFDQIPPDAVVGSSGATGQVDVTIRHDGVGKVIAFFNVKVNTEIFILDIVGSSNGGV